MRKIFALGEANGVVVVPHSPYFGPGLLASIHVCAASAREIPDRALLLRLHRDAVRRADHSEERRLCRAAGAGAGAGPELNLVERMRVA
jgi:hypothetical protein